MRPAPHRSPFAVALLIPVLLAALHSSAKATWPDPGAGLTLPVSATAGYQLSPSSCSDGAGGVIIAWNDNRPGGGSYHIYAQRVDATGRARWTANGLAICTAAGSQNLPQVIEDGAGGAFITWYDTRNAGTAEDIYAQHIDGNGASLWTAGGVPVCTATASQLDPRLVSDGAGGIFVAWRDYRSGTALAYAQHLNAAGVAQWAANGAPFNAAATSGQDAIAIASDGLGGFLAAWRIPGVTPMLIVANHFNANLASVWAAGAKSFGDPQGDAPQIASGRAGDAYIAYSVNGTLDLEWLSYDNTASASFLTGSGTTCALNSASIAPDGLGGVIMAWASASNQRYATRLSAGWNWPWWLQGSTPVLAVGSNTWPAAIVPDGLGGAAFALAGNGGAVSAVHVSRAGAVDWPGSVVPLTNGIRTPSAPIVAVSDGSGGAILAWSENNPVPALAWDVMAQRVDKFGYVGAEPQIVKVRDVRNDQGGWVEIQWNASRLDAPGDPTVADYSIWRQVPVLAAQAAMRQGATRLVSGEPRPADMTRALLTTGAAASAAYWEYVGQQPSRGLASYSYVAPTKSDSVPGSNPYTKFMVMAEHSPATLYWSSVPDSGYSVDNLPPGPPAPVAIAYRAGTSYVHWSPVASPDLAGYRVYRGASSSFTPSLANLVGAPADTGFADAGSSLTQWYKLSAVDIHGNESAFVTAQPWSTTGVEPALPARLTLRGAFPNPARSGATIRYALPAAGRVDLAILDLAGRRVRTLAAGDVPAGEQAAAWDGRDAGCRPVAPGLYFVRLEVAGRVLRARLTVLE